MCEKGEPEEGRREGNVVCVKVKWETEDDCGEGKEEDVRR